MANESANDGQSTISLHRNVKRALRQARTVLQPDFTNELLINNEKSYEDILGPLLLDKPIDQKRKRSAPIAIKSALNVPIGAILNLNVMPGEPYFVMWFLISSYFPLIAACLGPLANMISIIALIQHWRQDPTTEVLIPDPHSVLVMNALSLALGIIGNISLLMNFSRSVKYLITQCVSICAWFCASALLVAGVLVTHYKYMGDYKHSEGFFFACFTAGYYFACMLILLINFLGYRLDKYPATFNLDQKQRTLMVYTILFAIWSVVGAVTMHHLILGLGYGLSLYYCIVSFLTIGLGDITPKTAAAKIVVLVFLLGGVLIMGLIVATLRSVILSSAAPAIFWNDIEIARLNYIKKLKIQDRPISPENAYRKMRRIRHKIKVKHMNFSLALTVIIFLAFWLIGAMIFHFIEEWTYFNGVYFCFLCLLTIGYGDFAPKQSLGRVFFVSWATGAVPLMTILVSNVGDKLYEVFNNTSAWFSKWIFQPDREYLAKKKIKQQMKEYQEDETSTTSSFLLEQIKEDFDSSAFDEDTDNEEEFDDDDDDEEDEDEDEEEDEEEEEDGVEEAEKEEDEQEDDDLRQIDSDLEELSSEILDNSSSASTRMNVIRDKLFKRKDAHERLLHYLERLKPLISDGITNPNKKYTLSQWQRAYKALELQKLPDGVDADPYTGFWLGNYSPLRLPLKEPNYLILRVYYKIEETLQMIVNEEKNDLEMLELKGNALLANSLKRRVKFSTRGEDVENRVCDK